LNDEPQIEVMYQIQVGIDRFKTADLWFSI